MLRKHNPQLAARLEKLASDELALYSKTLAEKQAAVEAAYRGDPRLGARSEAQLARRERLLGGS